MSLVQDANDHAALNPGLYAGIERGFDLSYLGMLLVRGLVNDLPVSSATLPQLWRLTETPPSATLTPSSCCSTLVRTSAFKC